MVSSVSKMASSLFAKFSLLFFLLLGCRTVQEPELSRFTASDGGALLVTIISKDQSVFDRFRHWASDAALKGGADFLRKKDLHVTFVKILPANTTSVPPASQLTSKNSSSLCPLYVGDQIEFEFRDPFVADGHLNLKVRNIMRTETSKTLLQKNAPAQSEDYYAPGYDPYKNQDAKLEVNHAVINSVEPQACASLLAGQGGFLFKGHLAPEDLRRVQKKHIALLYDPGVGEKLGNAIQNVSCARGMCLQCVYRAFERAFPGAWPVHEDSSTINAGSCARSFADFWQEKYEKRMKIKRVWWGKGDPRNLILDPYYLPKGSVLVWDICGSTDSCPGGPGIGDIGIITHGSMGGKSRVSMIASWYPPTSVAQWDKSVCSGKLTGAFLPWNP